MQIENEYKLHARIGSFKNVLGSDDLSSLLCADFARSPAHESDTEILTCILRTWSILVQFARISSSICDYYSERVAISRKFCKLEFFYRGFITTGLHPCSSSPIQRFGTAEIALPFFVGFKNRELTVYS
jgi:hypothetical protein